MNNNYSDNITEERNLISIYKKIRLRLPKSNINKFSTLGVFTMLFVYSVSSNESSYLLLEKTRKWSEIGISFSGGILGFLIAGFTIFASINDKSLFVEMAKREHPESGLSYLKYNFFTLMYVFISYLGFTIICLLIQLFGGSSGLISIIVKFSTGEYFLLAKRLLSGVGIILIGTWFFYSLMLLQSFIFNVYHIVMTAIRWEIEK